MPLIDPGDKAWQDVYRVLIDCIQPRPIGFISTVDAEGRPNLAPYSFFNMVSANPPVCFFSPGVKGRGGGQKDSHRNVLEVPEFVHNVVTEDIARRMNQTAFEYGHGESEFGPAGLTPEPSGRVRPPRVAESPVNLECRVVDIKSFGDWPGAGTVIFGEIVLIHVREGLLDDGGRISPARLRTIGRLGGSEYCTTRDTFTLHRPRSADYRPDEMD